MAPDNKTQANTNKIMKFSKRPHPDSDIEELNTYFPTYIIPELVEDKPITQLSPFITEKFLSQIS